MKIERFSRLFACFLRPRSLVEAFASASGLQHNNGERVKIPSLAKPGFLSLCQQHTCMKSRSAPNHTLKKSSSPPLAVVKTEELPTSPSTLLHLGSPSTTAHSHLGSAEGGKEDQQRSEKQRTVPCEQCRKIRRACKWVDNFEVCERCWRSGRVCTGPSR
jgi:hypothetical protein